MALSDIAHTSQLGPNNPGGLGTGTVSGFNTDPLSNAQFGNPNANNVIHDSLEAAAHSSNTGPNNPGGKGTGTVAGINNNPLSNAQLGNPNANTIIHNSLEAAAHSSRLGSFNGAGTPGTGVIVDTLGNIPAEVNFNGLL